MGSGAREYLQALMDEPLRAARTLKRTVTGARQGGYADAPGTGPEGETCRSCAHLTRREHDRAYLKCGLMSAHWTSGRATDVLARSPACSRWEAKAP